MVNHIVNEEACHGDKVSSLVSVYAYLAKGKQQGNGSCVCWHCGKPGHIKNFCTRKVPEQGSLVMVLQLVVRLVWFLVVVVMFQTWLIWVLMKLDMFFRLAV